MPHDPAAVPWTFARATSGAKMAHGGSPRCLPGAVSGTDALHCSGVDMSSALNAPPAVRLVRALAPTLHGLSWGVGGSCLLWRLGLVAEPRDLDLVTTSADFAELARRLSRVLGPSVDVPHATYRSRCFARFAAADEVAVDLFADVVVRTAKGESAWSFDPGRVDLQDGIPWMLAVDWRELYALFDRPHRVRQLEDYLGREAPESGSGRDARRARS